MRSTSRSPGLIIAADTGGTFTDLTAFDRQTGEVTYAKSLTTYGNLVDGVMNCIDKAALDLRRADLIKFGTTLVINTYVQRNGARTALVTTSGFRDVPEIGRGNRATPFDIRYRRDAPLVERRMRLEIDERVDSEGRVLRPVRDADVAALAEMIRRLDAEAVAVSLFNSYANQTPEQELAAALRKALPSVYVTAGTDISREWYEYERTSTAMANAYVGPRLRAYIDDLDGSLRRRGFDSTFYMMASNGGVASVARATRRPVTLVESGPVGGIIGAGVYGTELGIAKVVGFDMGGTTAKCAVIEDGRFDVKSPYYVGGADHGFPVRGGVLDIVEVGAGGGSIASVDEFGHMSVGPRSAGSEPGPICYGRGGTEVTITDANLVLGRIGAASFLGGEMSLDADGARAGMAALANRLGLEGDDGVDQMAHGILSLAALTMSAAVRQITIERGIDPRDFVMVAFGGGGPLHCVQLARELDMAGVVIPPEPGVFSALGMVLSDARVDETETFMRPLTENVVAEMRVLFASLEKRIAGELAEELDGADITFERQVEMRFKGQHHTLRMPLGELDVQSVRRDFEALYKLRFGHVDHASPVEFVNLVVAATARLDRPDPRQLVRDVGRESGSPQFTTRSVYYVEVHGRIDTPVYQRRTLPFGFEADGPALIEEYGSTTVVGPDDRFRVGQLGEIRVSFNAASEARPAGAAKA